MNESMQLIQRPCLTPDNKRHDRVSLLEVSLLAAIASFAVNLQRVYAAETPPVPPSVEAGSRAISCADFLDSPKISKIREAFDSLGRMVADKLDSFVSSDENRKRIRSTFDRKKYRGLTLCFDRKLSHPALFDGPSRTITFGGNFDADDMGYLVTLVHELAHVSHDERYRRLPRERYDAYWHAKRGDAESTIVVVPEDEADAIGRQIEVLNISMHGELKAKIMKGEWVPIPTKNEYMQKFLSQFAWQYYRNPQGFVAFVKRIYMGTPGAVIFNRDLARAE